MELAGRSLRYHKISYSTEALDRLLAELYIESHVVPPAQIVLDLDATDIPLYGPFSTPPTVSSPRCY